MNDTMAENNNNIETGIEYECDVNHEDAEVYGYVDNGEHAVVYAVWEDKSVESYGVAIYNCEAGLSDRVGRQDQSMKDFESVEAVAREMIARNPKTDIEEARAHFQ